MDSVIGEILKTIRFKSVLYFKHGFCGNWGMDVPQGKFAQFHFVTSRQCLLHVGDYSTRLQRGDLVILPRGTAHQLRDSDHSLCRPGNEVVQEIIEGAVEKEEGEVTTGLICGHFEMDDDVKHPILDNLPDLIIVKEEEYGKWSLMYSSLELIINELERRLPGHRMISLKLAEVIFVSVIRHHYMSRAGNESNLFKDKIIFNAVELMHQNISASWNVGSLAQRVGISRTLFIDRFKKAVGDTPIRYLTCWRMTKAKYLLKTTELGLSEIANHVGYPSESSFNRAFKKWNLMTPGKYRKEAI